ncbi:MAG: PQQ-binding-like beta-propeller repeat protein [Methanomassiliicoccales archaeon]|nr:MAG: PQQ-binding-like beta-propeller repeat protein [Methanomassiliicoccales archaeon]
MQKQGIVMKRIVTILACAMLLALIAMPANSTSSDTKCWVLFDFGNGEVGWASVDVDPSMNAFNVTERAAEQLGYQLTVEYYGGSPFIVAVQGYFPDYLNWIYWGLYTWDVTTSTWVMSWVGAADVPATSVTAIAWSYAATPTATPYFQRPWTSFRQDAAGGGSQSCYAPNNISLAYSKNLSNGAIDAPIVSANGLSYVVTSGIVNSTTHVLDTDSVLYCLDSEGEVRWSANIGKGYQTSSPLIFNGLLVVSSADGTVYAFDLLSGTEVWTYDLGTGEVYGPPSPIGVTNRIYVASAEGEITCLRLDGTEDWDLDLGVGIYSSSPSVEQGRLYIGTEDGRLFAVDISTPTVLWSIDLGEKVRGTPIYYDGNIYVTFINGTSGGTRGGLAAVDHDGNLLWKTVTGVSPASATLTRSGIAMVDSSKLYMIGLDGEIDWEMPLGTMLLSGGAPTSVNGTIFLVTNEASSRLVGVSESGVMYINIVLAPDSYALCVPTIADGKLYATTDGGYVYVYNLNEIPPSTVTSTFEVDGMKVSFSVEGVTEGTYFDYIWDFGDGDLSTGPSVDHEYDEEGSYTAKLTVKAPNGDSQTYEMLIEVKGSNDKGDAFVILFIIVAITIILVVIAFVMLRRRK